MLPNRTVETLDGLEIPVERIVSYRTFMLSLSGPCMVKIMVLTDRLGEAVEKNLKLGFEDLGSACSYMNSLLDSKVDKDVRSGKLLPLW